MIYDRPFIPESVPLNIKSDDRGFGIYDIFGELLERMGLDFNQGQINVTTTYRNAKRAWHMHEKQYDLIAVVKGEAIIVIWRVNPRIKEIESRRFVIGEHSPKIIVIPPGWWHGFAPVNDEPFTMVYFVSEKYNPRDPDEKRTKFGEELPEVPSLEVEVK